MSAPPTDDRIDAPDPPATGGELHNTVLMRSSKPVGANHSWIAPAVLGVAIVAGAIIWSVFAGHTGPVVNHSVAAAPTSFAPTGPG